MNIYDFTVIDSEGREQSLSKYKGKVLLIFNSATDCAFTPQYKDLQWMYRDHRDDGLVILDFPCNQFGNQAPGTTAEIKEFCEVRYGVTFPQMQKCDVFGETAIPLFKYLCENTKFGGFTGDRKEFFNELAFKMDPGFKDNGNIKWNFTKFLIDREGNIVRRFEITEPMDEVRRKTEELL